MSLFITCKIVIGQIKKKCITRKRILPCPFTVVGRKINCLTFICLKFLNVKFFKYLLKTRSFEIYFIQQWILLWFKTVPITHTNNFLLVSKCYQNAFCNVLKNKILYNYLCNLNCNCKCNLKGFIWDAGLYMRLLSMWP